MNTIIIQDKRTKSNWVSKKNTNELKKSWQDLKMLNPSLMNAMKYKCFTNFRYTKYLIWLENLRKWKTEFKTRFVSETLLLTYLECKSYKMAVKHLKSQRGSPNSSNKIYGYGSLTWQGIGTCTVNTSTNWLK